MATRPAGATALGWQPGKVEEVIQRFARFDERIAVVEGEWGGCPTSLLWRKPWRVPHTGPATASEGIAPA
jgi:hypothetical protein